MKEFFEHRLACGEGTLNVSWCFFHDSKKWLVPNFGAVWVRPALHKMVFPLQTSSLLFKLLSASFWAVAKAIATRPPNSLAAGAQQPPGLVSGSLWR